MEENKNKTYPTQMVLTIRAIVGGYVLYQAYQILTSGNEKSILMYMMVVLLIIGGAGILGFAIKQFIKGEYEGGKADVSSQEAIEIEPVEEETIETVEPEDIEELD